jgi:cell division septation protein DedD
MRLEHQDFHEDEEQEEYPPRSIFAAGWFRAVLIMTLLAIAVVVALPYLLNWFDSPAPPDKRASPPVAGIRAATGSAPSDPAPARASTPVAGMESEAPATSAPSKPAGQPVRPAAPAPSVFSASIKPLPSGQAVRTSAATPRAEPVMWTKQESIRHAGPSGYWVQLGLFREQANAERLAGKLREQSFAIQVARVTRQEATARGVPPGTYHVVRAGGFANSARAVAARDALAEKGYPGFVTQDSGR